MPIGWDLIRINFDLLGIIMQKYFNLYRELRTLKDPFTMKRAYDYKFLQNIPT